MQKVLIILIQCLKNLRQGTSSLSEQGKFFSLWVKTSIRPLIDHQRILFCNSIGLKLTPTFKIFRFVSILSRED